MLANMTNSTSDSDMDWHNQRTVEWLQAQYDEIETTAREAGADDVPAWTMHDDLIIGADPRYHSVIIDRSATPTWCQRSHIASHDPSSVMADIHAKRLIIDIVRQHTSADGQQRAAQVIHALATALAHRPDCPATVPHATARLPPE